MRVTNEGPIHPMLSSTSGIGGTTPSPGGGGTDPGDIPTGAWQHVLVANPAIVTTTGEIPYVPLTGDDGLAIMVFLSMA